MPARSLPNWAVQAPNCENETRAAATRRIYELLTFEDKKVPAETDFSKGVRGLDHIPPGAKVFLPASIERSVWEYFSGKAEQKGIDLSES